MIIKNFLYWLVCFILFWPIITFAQTPLKKLEDIRSSTGYGVVDTGDPGGMMIRVIGDVINVFLSILGAIFVILIIYAGYNWMTANGEEQKVDKAKDTIRRAIIGLIITVSAYAIWNFVSRIL